MEIFTDSIRDKDGDNTIVVVAEGKRIGQHYAYVIMPTSVQHWFVSGRNVYDLL